MTKVVIHHTAVSNSVQPDAQKQITAAENRAIQVIGQPADSKESRLPYHYMVDQFGGVHPTREHESVGWHASNLAINNESIAICMIGHFDQEEPSAKQVGEVKRVIKVLKEKYGELELSFHNEFAAKTCPGGNVNKSMFVGNLSDGDIEYQKNLIIEMKSKRVEENESENRKDLLMHYSKIADLCRDILISDGVDVSSIS